MSSYHLVALNPALVRWQCPAPDRSGSPGRPRVRIVRLAVHYRSLHRALRAVRLRAAALSRSPEV